MGTILGRLSSCFVNAVLEFQDGFGGESFEIGSAMEMGTREFDRC